MFNDSLFIHEDKILNLVLVLYLISIISYNLVKYYISMVYFIVANWPKKTF